MEQTDAETMVTTLRRDIPVADSVIAYNARVTARPSYARAEQTNGPL